MNFGSFVFFTEYFEAIPFLISFIKKNSFEKSIPKEQNNLTLINESNY